MRPPALRTGTVRVTIRTQGGVPMGAIVAALRSANESSPRIRAGENLAQPAGPPLARGVDCAGYPSFGRG